MTIDGVDDYIFAIDPDEDKRTVDKIFKIYGGNKNDVR
jgi:hypothetical protein